MVLKGLVIRRKNRCVDAAKVLVVTCHGPFGANSYALYVVERESVQPNACKRLNFEQVEFTPYFSPVSVKNTQHSFLRGSLRPQGCTGARLVTCVWLPRTACTAIKFYIGLFYMV